MSDERLNELSGLYIQHDIKQVKGYEFWEFVNAVNCGTLKLEGME